MLFFAMIYAAADAAAAMLAMIIRDAAIYRAITLYDTSCFDMLFSTTTHQNNRYAHAYAFHARAAIILLLMLLREV